MNSEIKIQINSRSLFSEPPTWRTQVHFLHGVLQSSETLFHLIYLWRRWDLTFERSHQHGRHFPPPLECKATSFFLHMTALPNCTLHTRFRDTGTHTNPGASQAERAWRPVRAARDRPSQTKIHSIKLPDVASNPPRNPAKIPESLVPARVSGLPSPCALKTCTSSKLKLMCVRESCRIKRVW